MYEPEVNGATEPLKSVPEDARLRFSEFRGRVIARTTIPWGEHCTECVWPVCYTTCALYERRADGACRQFAGSAVRIDHREGLSPYILKVRFKQWAKFWAPGTLELKPIARANRAELVHIAAGAVARAVPLPQWRRERVLGRINYRRRMAAERERPGPETPDYFLLECFNPEGRTLSLTLSMRARKRNDLRAYQLSIALQPGYTRASVPFSEIAAALDVTQPFEIEMVPNQCENLTLYFGLMDFVKLAAPETQPGTSPPEKPIKCVVWDLDNTLWDGVLLEDGPEGVRVRADVIDIIKSCDERGILHSIASKNNPQDVLPLLNRLRLDEYFLFPQIGWTAKSESIRRIARQLNLGVDAIAFVDDQPFEREEVKAALPEVTLVDAVHCQSILALPGCGGLVTDESRRRRLMYREQEHREAALAGHAGDYLSFLRSCGIHLAVRPLSEDNLHRVYELAQRTNQMNFSGNRYDEPELRRLLARGDRASFVVHCKDRFGDYGIVGFAVVDTSAPCLIDLMFSCRVQAKRVEHAVLAFLVRRFTEAQPRDFFAQYRRTERNAAAGKVFEELGFNLVEEKDGLRSLVFPRDRAVPDDGVVQVTSEMREAANA